MGLLERSDWQEKWIMGDYDHDTNPKVRYPVDCFRKEVALKKGLARARLYATACGLYEACVDGEKVGDQVMAPGSTDFQKRVHYQTYDVTALLAGKETAELTFQLADGYYASRQGVFGKAKPFGAEPKLLAQLELYYEDGTEVILGTDETFSWSNDGPIRLADMKDGEVTDLRMVPSYGGFARETAYEGAVCASDNVPVREKERFSNPKVIHCPDGHTVLDFGQNLAGYMEVSLQGPAGSQVFHGFRRAPE